MISETYCNSLCEAEFDKNLVDDILNKLKLNVDHVSIKKEEYIDPETGEIVYI